MISLLCSFVGTVHFLLFLIAPGGGSAFLLSPPPLLCPQDAVLSSSIRASFVSTSTKQLLPPCRFSTLLAASSSSPQENDDEYVNPYQDPNYPDLEFVDYSLPSYQVDQGVSDEFFSTEDEIENMREERRLRNDEYQFQTYFAKTCSGGVEHLCDWTVYQTSTFLEGNGGDEGIPRLIQAQPPLRVRARATKKAAATLVEERIVHEEFIHTDDWNDSKGISLQSYHKQYWPEELSPFDFRGHQGIMVCGNAWTICTAESLSDDRHTGPFSEYRAELGIQHQAMRFRVKLDYSTLPGQQKKASSPPLFLKYLTICREIAVEQDDDPWPRDTKNMAMSEALFGIPGADGGLYDPPPIEDHTTSQYISLDLPGHATVLLPYKMDQQEDSRTSRWVTSLDWTPGVMRYQVDRKVGSGVELLGLRSLELSEVQSADAETYRPRDGGQNMRQ